MAFINKKPLTIILGFLAVLQLSLFYYYSISVEREYRAEKADLSSQAVTLTSNLEEKVSAVKGISSFIQTVGFDAEPALINQYLYTAYNNSNTNVMNIVIAPYGVIRYLYPLSGNTSILNKDLLLDPVLSSSGMVQETIRSRGITIDGPRMLAQGQYGMVIRQAIYSGNTFTGIVSATVTVEDIADHLQSLDSSIYVTSTDYTLLFGRQDGAAGEAVTTPIDIYNQHWLMGTLFRHRKMGSIPQRPLD